jgi:sugar phosphate isomerase/epimerase
MEITRRTFTSGAAMLTGWLSAHGRGLDGLKIGVTDWNLRKAADPSAVALASSLGFEGVEVSLGRKAVDGKLPLDHPGLISTYREAFRTHKIPPAGTCLDVLHVNYLKNDDLGQKWISDGVRLTKELDAKVMLLPFFGRGALQTQTEKDYVGDVLRELAPEAEKAGITLGLENTISAKDNVRIMERARSNAVLVYYDVGNSTNNGFDIVPEIRWLGAERICQVHLKDNPNYLGEGSISFPAVLQALSGIGFKGFANLETSAPSKSIEADMRRNLAYIRRVLDQVRSA